MGRIPPDFIVRKTYVNGRPGLVSYLGDGSPQSVVTFDVLDGRVRTIRLLVNPEKLENVPPLEQQGEDAGWTSQRFS